MVGIPSKVVALSGHNNVKDTGDLVSGQFNVGKLRFPASKRAMND
jgi:hypothetical protein